MKAIYASKLYKASSRKEKIRAAIENPVNAELVSQLAEYLDEEYQTPQYLEGKPDTSAASPSSESEGGQGTGDASQGSASSGGGRFSGGGSGGGSTDMHLDDVVLDEDGNPIEEDSEEGGDDSFDSLDFDSVDNSDGSDDTDDSSFDDAGLEDIDEATDIEGIDSGVVEHRVGSDFDVTDVPNVQPTETDSPSKEETLLSNNVESIKLMLNAEEETEGVERIALKNSELWIYYNDFVNLNNIMSPVIEFFARGSFTYLEFNRLARSANAIVFQVCVDNKRL